MLLNLEPVSLKVYVIEQPFLSFEIVFLIIVSIHAYISEQKDMVTVDFIYEIKLNKF